MEELLRPIVFAIGFRVPVNRRPPSLRLADSPEPTPKTISRRANLKFRPLAKLISGNPAVVALSFFGFSCALPPIENSEEPQLFYSEHLPRRRVMRRYH